MSLLIQESPLLILPTLAQTIGLEEAILLQQLHFRLTHQGQERDGKRWYCQSYTNWAKQLPFWSESKIKRLFLKLEKEGFIQSTDKYITFYVDRTKWYSIEYHALDSLLHINANENYHSTVYTETLPMSSGERSDRAHDERTKRKDFKDVQKEKDNAQAHLSLFAKNEQTTQQQEERTQLAFNSPVHTEYHDRTQPTEQLDELSSHAPIHSRHHERAHSTTQLDNQSHNQLHQDTQLQHLSNQKTLATQIDHIIQYLNNKTGKRFNLKTTANRKLIHARLRDGYTVQDCYQVIDNQVKLWQHDPKMQAYLRPQTLFRASNFESYLNNAVKQHELLFSPPARVELDFTDN